MESRPGRLGYGPKVLYFPANFVFSPKFRLTAATTAPVRCVGCAYPFTLQLYLHKPGREVSRRRVSEGREREGGEESTARCRTITARRRIYTPHIYIYTTREERRRVAPFFIVISLRAGAKETRRVYPRTSRDFGG